MSKIKYLQVYTVSVSKLYHVIPFFIIMWKFCDSLFIILLTLILSHVLIVIILGRSTLDHHAPIKS